MSEKKYIVAGIEGYVDAVCGGGDKDGDIAAWGFYDCDTLEKIGVLYGNNESEVFGRFRKKYPEYKDYTITF